MSPAWIWSLSATAWQRQVSWNLSSALPTKEILKKPFSNQPMSTLNYSVINVSKIIGKTAETVGTAPWFYDPTICHIPTTSSYISTLQANMSSQEPARPMGHGCEASKVTEWIRTPAWKNEDLSQRESDETKWNYTNYYEYYYVTRLAGSN